jgi:myo-inositol-1(or 4)-monophosphatase
MGMMKFTKKNFQEIFSFMQDIGYEAGEIILKFQKERQFLSVTSKGAEGIASEADDASEDFLIKAIKEKYPKHKILSEEDYSKQKKKNFKVIQESKYIWVLDPLDGTNNFVNGIPIYAISMALMHEGKSIAGLVYNPFSGECFFAGKKQGAYLIDFRINPMKKYELQNEINSKSMNECIFSPAPTYEKKNKFENQLSTFKKNIIGARAVRRLGSAALELCYVASGNFDGYWEKNLKPWDVAAAVLICEEAGVKVTDFDGQSFSVLNDSVIAAREPLHTKILGKIIK